ncbi:SdiA-regulated domain-containing protein [Sinobacterium caligoides]|nr:SdiA-regulated domain-containing protein [Sinobacterium caligoides]
MKMKMKKTSYKSVFAVLSVIISLALIRAVYASYSVPVGDGLKGYNVAVEAHLVEGVDNNLSGITFNDDTQRLWAVMNGPTQLLELDKKMNVLRKVKLVNFSDTEAVVYAGEGRFLIVDERLQSVVLVRIDADTKAVDRKDAKKFTLNVGGNKNKGWEGLAINRENNDIFVARERDPMQVIKIKGFLSSDGSLELEKYTEDIDNKLGMDDFSGLHFDQYTGHLMVLSDESRALAEIDGDANILGYMKLESGEHRLAEDLPQPEGVTTDDEGNIYIVSEPNLIYRFDRG